jgi:diguanylate cyclase (GGDEF)-like protein
MQKRDHPRQSRTPTYLVFAPAALALVSMLLAGPVTSPALGWDVAWTAASVSALAAMLLARQRAIPEHRGRWTLWALAAMSWLVGQLAWDLFGAIGSPASPNLADAGYWGFAVIVIVAMVRPSRARSLSLRVVAAAETVPLIAAAMALTGAELWPNAMASSLPLASKLSALVYPAVYVSAAVLTLQAMVGGSLRRIRSIALPLVLSGIVTQAVAFILWSKQLLEQSYVTGTTVLDPLWLVGMIAIAAGGVVAAHRPEQVAPVDEPSFKGGILPAAMFLALLGGLVNAVFDRSPTGSKITLAAGLLFSGVTLIVRGLVLQRRMGVLLARERAALASVAEREAELARLNDQLVEDSRRDALTGMRNRWALSDDLPRLDAVREEHGDTFAVALCDIDHFKAYNDRLGHLAGDQALRAISATVRGALRGGDVAYRFGGEELLLVLPNASARQALAAAERVRCAVQTAALPHRDGIGGVLTLSIGVAAGAGDSGTLLASADAALYEAKRAGRNRVVMSSELVSMRPAARSAATSTETPIPRHLRSMLEISRAAASGHGVMPVLEALAETIRKELSFQVVAVNLLDETRRDLRVVLVLGDDEAREQLLGTVNPWSEWEPLMDSEHERSGAIWLPAGSHDWTGDTTVWTPAVAAAPDPNAWHPLDMLLLPLRGAGDDVLAVVSVDQPLAGHRPDDAELTVLMAVADHAGLALEQAQREMTETNGTRERSQELLLAAMMLLAETVDLRDAGTGQHSRMVGGYARRLAEALNLSPARVERIYAAGVLHDLGKLGLADAILYKPGPLDEQELEEIKRHPEIGARILEHAGMHDIAGWVRAHHERIDGRGYPRGLEAGRIPLEARILAVVDAYEAMIVDRPYRRAIAPADAIDELRRCAGTQFDPQVVEAFIAALRVAGEPGVDQLADAA